MNTQDERKLIGVTEFVSTSSPILPLQVQYEGSQNKEWYEIPLGVGVWGEISWNTMLAPHMLLCGSAGSGKSIAQAVVIAHCIQHSDKITVLCIDISSRPELSQYEKYEHAVYSVATNLEDAVEVLRFTRIEMESRYIEMKANQLVNFEKITNPPKALFLVVDKVSSLMPNVRTNMTRDEEQEEELRIEAASIILSISRLGRAAGIHLVLTTHRPDANIITGDMKANLGARYAVGNMDAPASHLTLDSDAGTKTPKRLSGRAVLSIHGKEESIQGYYVNETTIRDLNGVMDGLPDLEETTRGINPEEARAGLKSDTAEMDSFWEIEDFDRDNGCRD